MTDNLRYPIGQFEFTGPSGDEQRREWIHRIAALPSSVRAAVGGLADPQLDTPYRPGGWTIRQVVHHLADSHINSYVRFRLALTELDPTIKPYDEKLWADLPDARTSPVGPSLALLDSLHHRWVLLLNSLAPGDFTRTFRHPELGVVSLERSLALYAWHGQHHTAHITSLRDRMGWR